MTTKYVLCLAVLGVSLGNTKVSPVYLNSYNIDFSIILSIYIYIYTQLVPVSQVLDSSALFLGEKGIPRSSLSISTNTEISKIKICLVWIVGAQRLHDVWVCLKLQKQPFYFLGSHNFLEIILEGHVYSRGKLCSESVFLV